MPKVKKIIKNGKVIAYLSGIKCPVCKQRWETTTPNPNLLNHVKAAARNELLARHIVGDNSRVIHADWLRDNVKIEPTYVRRATIKLGKDKLSFNLSK